LNEDVLQRQPRQKNRRVRTSWPVCAAALGLAVSGLTAACGNQSASARAGLFWAQSPHGGEAEQGSIGRAHLDGSGADGRFIIGAKAPAGLALHDGYVYWANYGSGTIARANLDGTNVANAFIDGADYPAGVAIAGRHIFWTNSFGLDPNSGTIGRANLDGSGVDQHFLKAGDSPVGLAADDSHLYWTNRYWNRDFTLSRYAIGRSNLDGSGVDRRFIDVTNKIDGVAVNDRYIYWSNNGEDAIGRANIDGTGVDQRCVTPRDVPLGNVPEGLAVDDRHVYWANYPANTIGRANLDGSDLDERFVVVKGVPEGVAAASNHEAASPGACVDPHTAPILFGPTDYRAGYCATGWGEVAPPTISNGGAAASGTISRIHWSSWGGKVAVGRGVNPTYTPHGGYYRKPVVIELRASAIRRCNPGGRLVYTRFVTREQVRPEGPMGKWFAWNPNMCVGFR
jgi:Low-density lipoprotein receptor repeat class B